MRLFGDLLPYESALAVIMEHIAPLTRTERVAIDYASGRVLAQDLVATHSIPPFDRAGVDGYAVRARDTEGASPQSTKSLRVVETVYAGSASAKRVSSGEAIQIATGARIPKGVDAVVMVEDTRHEGNRVFILKATQPGENVGHKGDDITKGELLLKVGTIIDPSKLGVLASQGMRRVEVYEKPRVAILPTGEEIVELGRRLRGSQIYDINSHTLAAVVRQNGGIPVTLPITGDRMEELKAALARALEADLVLTSGGSSVGEKDLLMNLLEEWGRVFFHGVKIKPGKPTTFSEVRGKPVLGMPGNPTTCLMTAYLFLAPALRQMTRLPPIKNMTVKARLAERVTGSSGRTQFLPVRIEGNRAYSVFKESSAITSISRAEGYVVIPEDAILDKGTPVQITLF